MNIIPEALGIVFNSAISLAISILKAIFGIKDSIDSFQDLMLATAFGIPVWVITLISGIITLAGIVLFVIKIFKRLSN